MSRRFHWILLVLLLSLNAMADRVSLDFHNADLRDVLWALAQETGMNLTLSPEVSGRVTAVYRNVSAVQALGDLLDAHGYVLVKRGEAYLVARPEAPGPMEIARGEAGFDLRLQEAPLREVLERLSALSGQMILLDTANNPRLSLVLQNASLELALEELSQASGLGWREEGGRIRFGGVPLRLEWEGGLLTLQARGVPLDQVIAAMNRETGLNLLLTEQAKGEVTLSFARLTPQEAAQALAKSQGLNLVEEAGLLILRPRPAYQIQVSQGYLSMDLRDVDLAVVIAEIARQAGLSVITRVQGRASAVFNQVPVLMGLEELVTSHGYALLRQGESLYRVAEPTSIRPSQTLVSMGPGGIDLTLTEVPLREALAEISRSISQTLVAEPGHNPMISLELRGASSAEVIEALSLASGLAAIPTGRGALFSGPRVGLHVEVEADSLSLYATRAPLEEVIKEISAQLGQTISLDPSITGTLSLNLVRLAPADVLRAIAREVGASLQADSRGFRLTPQVWTNRIWMEGELLSLEVDGDLAGVLREIAGKTGINLIHSGVTGRAQAVFHLVSPLQAVEELLRREGYHLEERGGGIYGVSRETVQAVRVSQEGAGLHLDIRQAPLGDVLEALSQVAGQGIWLSPGPNPLIHLRLIGASLEEALESLSWASGLGMTRTGGGVAFGGSRVNLVMESVDGLVSMRAQDVPLDRAVRELHALTGLNIVLDSGAQGNLSLSLQDLTPLAAAGAMARALDLRLVEREGYSLMTPARGVHRLEVQNGLLYMDIGSVGLDEFLREISRQSGLNLITDGRITTQISGVIDGLPVLEGVRKVLASQGLELIPDGQAYMVRQPRANDRFQLSIQGERISLTAQGADLGEILSELSRRMGFDLITSNSLRHTTGIVRVQDLSLEDLLKALLQGSPYTYLQEGDVFYLGDAMSQRADARNLVHSEVLHLTYLNAQQAISLLPPIYPASNIRVVRDQNALLVTGDRGFIQEVRVFLQTIDRPGQAVATEVLRFEHVQANQIYQLLTRQYGAEPFSLMEWENAVMVRGPVDLVGEIQGFARRMDIPREPNLTQQIRLDYLRASEVPNLLIPDLKEVRYTIYPEQNMVIVNDRPELARAFEAYLRSIDLENPLIMFDIIVVEFLRTGGESLGVSLAGGTPNLSLGMDLAGGDGTKPFVLNLSPGGFTPNFRASLDALIQDGTAKVRANPRISTLNGHPAKFSVVTKSYYWDPAAEKATNEGGEIPRGAIRTIDTGITIYLNPWVSGRDEIIIDIEPTLSDSSSIRGSLLPQTNERSVKTTVRVKDQETIVIGGLIQTQVHESVERIPFLSHLPVIGSLLQSRRVIERESEFVIYITPHLVREGGAMHPSELQLQLDPGGVGFGR